MDDSGIATPFFGGLAMTIRSSVNGSLGLPRPPLSGSQ